MIFTRASWTWIEKRLKHFASPAISRAGSAPCLLIIPPPIAAFFATADDRPPEPQVIDFSPNDLAALQALGRRLGKLVARGDVICLNGPLGAGKTTMTQAMAQGMGLPADQPVTSPTYGIIHEHWGKHQEEYRGAPRREHQGQLPLFHLDLYRLGGTEEELLELGIEDYLYGDGVCVIEWPDRLGQLKPAVRLEVEIEFSGPTGRRVSLRDHAAGWTARLARESISQGV